MDGIHLLGEWYGCAADLPEMTRADPLRALCLRVSEASGMTVVGDRFFQFEPQGETRNVQPDYETADDHANDERWQQRAFHLR